MAITTTTEGPNFDSRLVAKWRPIKRRTLLRSLWIVRFDAHSFVHVKRNFCVQPRYRSVVWIETCSSRNWICSSSPPARSQSLAQHYAMIAMLFGCGLRMPACFAVYWEDSDDD